MGLLQSIQSIFTPSNDLEKVFFGKTPSTSVAVEKIFTHLQSLVNKPELCEEFIDKYQHLSLLDPQKREIPVIKLYKNFEFFIIKNKPPNITKEYTSATLRQEIASVVPLNELSDFFRVIFIPDREKSTALFVIGLEFINQISGAILGQKQLHSLIDQAAQGTIFVDLQADGQTIVMPPAINEKTKTMPVREVKSQYNKFYETLHQGLITSLGEEKAAEPFISFNILAQQIYAYDITEYLLDILPKEALDGQKLEFFDRQELERIVHEKTAQLDLVKNQLEQQLTQFQEQNQALEDTKKSMLNVLEDVEEEKNNAQLAKAKDDAILSSIGEALFVVDLIGNIELVNPVAQELLEIHEKDALGKLVTNVLKFKNEDGSPIPQENQPILTTLNTGGQINQTMLYTKKNDKKLTVNIITSPIKQNDKVIGALGIIRDITKEKEIDRMKTEFISLASHQLRTPLSAIRWFTEMLLGGDGGELNNEQKEFAKNISDSTQRMIQLVNSLLNISRMESGRILVDPRPTDLKELVQGVVTDLKAKIEDRKQNLLISVHDDLPKINLDPRLIRQVYLNLLTNAIKYTPKEGEITVFISKKDGDIITQISDNGYGIPRDQKDKIFQKFFRATNIIKVETDGTGLGLYLIKAIVESSKGKIWFESEEGKGTTFWFTLPLSGMEAKKGEVTLDE